MYRQLLINESTYCDRVTESGSMTSHRGFISANLPLIIDLFGETLERSVLLMPSCEDWRYVHHVNRFRNLRKRCEICDSLFP